MNINFYAWETDLMPKTSYRIPIVTKELFKLYFGSDANRVYNYIVNNNIPSSFTAGGFNVKYVASGGAYVFQLTK